MRFEILDVGHGFCAYAEAEDGGLVVFDCGHTTDPELRPSDHLYSRGHREVNSLIISNFDEDHISDLPNLQEDLQIRSLYRNPSISPEELERLKRQGGPISPAMRVLLSMLEDFVEDISTVPPLPGISLNYYWHSYGDVFSDTNNISFVTFLRVGDLSVLIPGDLEKPAWEEHLKNSYFREDLSGVDVFVASHHGHESGYCEQVFTFCQPDVVVFSDGPEQDDTQRMIETYANHARGTAFNEERVKVITTCKDGSVHWEI